MTTCVALVAVAVNVEELPGAMVVGLALRVTVVWFALVTVRFTVVYEAFPHLSHSSTTVCSAPAARVRDVLS